MKLLTKYLLAVFICLWIFPVTVKAYDFDANYYARKYPDVAASVGTSPEALYNHYITCGQYEGRYICQAEETEYYEKSEMKPKVEKPNQTTTSQSTENVTTTTQETTTTTISTPTTVIQAPYSTYIDVDITNQLVTYFENSELRLQTSCVTGNTSLGRGTPTGTYHILTHETNRYLIGPTWKSFVSYWMKFTPSACGLHDASWRSTFGGDIYKTNGSHGCVNLPYDMAKKLYDMVDVGTTVYVHY